MLNQATKKKPDEPPLNYWERRKLEKQAEAKKRVNIFMSRISGEETGTAYESSRSAFAGGEVESRSRVSLVGRAGEKAGKGPARGGSLADAARKKSGFALTPKRAGGTGLAKGGGPETGAAGVKPPARPLGFGR